MHSAEIKISNIFEKMRKLTKALILVIVFGFMFVIFASMFSDGGKACASNYSTPCKYYNYFTEMCVCIEGDYYLNNTMINARNEMIAGQNKILANQPVDYNFTKIKDVIFISNVSTS